jgi:LmeA-like phospholipid-binding
VALVVLLVLVVGGLVVVDRIGVHVAEGRVAEQLAGRAGLAGAPEVDITGFPFLTQALSGTYDDVRVHLTAAELRQPAGTRADVTLRGVHVPLSKVLSGSVRQIPVDSVDGTATLSYDLLAARLGGDTTVQPEGGDLRLTRTVDVLGFHFPVTATGTLRLDGQDVVVDVSSVAAAGVPVPGFVLRAAADTLAFRYPLPALPFGLQFVSVQPQSDGVDVRVQARDAVLSG